jgi:ABC-type polysaccharide/polyol phosphate export permease
MKMPLSRPGVWFLGAPGLLWQMTQRDFKGKYVGSLMGIFWTIINPLLLLLIFTFVFTVVFKARFGDQAGFGSNALYILAGVLPWLAFQEGIARASTVLFEHRNLITRVMFPSEILPGVSILSGILGQLIGFFILIILAILYLHADARILWFLPVLLILQFIFSIGLAWAVSAFCIYLRDLLHLIPVLLLVWMLGTPIFYPAALVPEKYQLLISLNPIAHLVSAYRAVIIEGSFPCADGILFLSIFAFLTLILGALIYRRLAPGFADRL